jgi:phospholipid-binding lipoprotein MlaA
MNRLLYRGVAAVVLAGAAATTQAQTNAANRKDPLEGWNRAVFSFNEGLDAALIKPVAQGYQAVVPELGRTGVSNFFANIGDVWSAVNNLLQGKGEVGSTMVFRVITNTFFGIGGLFDVASDLGMERRSSDFGLTLGHCGMPPGPYLVLPLLGPSTLRDTAALPLDLSAGPTAVSNDRATKNSLTALHLVDTRANLLRASKMLDDIALDKYSFLRDAYLARRRNLVYDGEPPPEPEEGDAAAPPK